MFLRSGMRMGGVQQSNSAVKVRQKRTEPGKADDKTAKIQDGEVSSNWQPADWREQLENVELMRRQLSAPVDRMGAESCANRAVGKLRRFEVLVSLMLSSQTRDQVTFAAMERLKNGNFDVHKAANMEPTDLEAIIRPVGFYKRKAQYITSAAKILREKYGGDIPRSADELCQLPGVGPKMAHLAMLIAWNEVTGIAVDTHVHRIANRMGWTKSATNTPDATRKELESWLPKELWASSNKLLVGFGQQICLPNRPKCTDCLNRNICSFARIMK